MKEVNTKTIRITKDAYKILSAEKKKLADFSDTSYTYSDIILTGLSLLDVLKDSHDTVIQDLLNKFKNARLENRPSSGGVGIEELFTKTVEEVKAQICSKFLENTIRAVITHLIEKGFPEAAMEVLLTNTHLFNEHERNSLSFEILSAIADKTEPRIREHLWKKLDRHI